MKEYNFYTALTQAQTLYGLDMTPDDFENIGIIAWDKIGNKRFRWYKYEVVPTKDDSGNYFIDLPCNADIIEAVTAGYEDYQKTSSMYMPGQLQNGWAEDYIEARKFNTGFGYAPGKFVKYTRDNNRLYLADDFKVVYVLYKGVLSDETGLPSLNEKEMDAVAAFCAYVTDFKKARMTKDQATFQMAKELEAQWKLKCTQARVPDYINQNEMDLVLNAATSWDRKRFGRSYKPMT